MLEGLIPVSSSHSISRVIATIFVPQSFLKPEQIFDRLKDDKQFGSYQKKTKIKPTTISFERGALDIVNDKIVGFVFEEYNESGGLKNVLKVENIRENLSTISIENRFYLDWNSFKKRLIRDVSFLADRMEIFVDAISLTYVDEFIWNSPNQIDVESIFNSSSELLNSKFKKSNNGTLISISQGKNGEQNYEEKTEVSFNNDVKRIAINHQYAVKLNSLKLFAQLQSSGILEKYFDVAHEANKAILKDVLSKESQSLIKLN